MGLKSCPVALRQCVCVWGGGREFANLVSRDQPGMVRKGARAAGGIDGA